MEHIVPIARGGAHTAANVVPACGPRNLKKGVRDVGAVFPHFSPLVAGVPGIHSESIHDSGIVDGG
jgi:5-methylcytosine-specific restriction endonuclease McrA